MTWNDRLPLRDTQVCGDTSSRTNISTNAPKCACRYRAAATEQSISRSFLKTDGKQRTSTFCTKCWNRNRRHRARRCEPKRDCFRSSLTLTWSERKHVPDAKPKSREITQ